MCGIAGLIKFTHSHPAPWAPPAHDVSALAAMSQALAHRGPDGHGLFLDPRPFHTAALLHRRLAIIDLPTGHQPMSNTREGSHVHVVFNGEIYNHADLRAQLQSAGHLFSTDHSDTEVLLHGWEQWGTELPSHLLGMFAFAIWDTRPSPTDNLPRDTLFLARDRLGQKPLYYATLEDGLAFASTIPSLLAWPEVPRRIPREQIALYLLLGYLPPPQTLYRDISQLLPGAWLMLQRDLLTGNRYWTPTHHDAPSQSSPPSTPSTQSLRQLLTQSVASQLLADTPIACFLSGGIDSSIIAALMQQQTLARGGNPITTVSVGFSESTFDETAFADQVAQKIRSHHTRLEVRGDQNIIETLRLLMRASLGQPFADSSILPTYHLSKAVRQIAPVALSGDGADELFAGYDRYRALTLLSDYGRLARFLPRSSPIGSLAKRERYRRLAAAARASLPSERYSRLIEIFPRADLEKLLGPDTLDYAPSPAEYGLPNSASALQLAMIRDQHEYLPADVLAKVDSASMLSALEVRSPFIDHRLVQFANSLPAEQHLFAGSKSLLKQSFPDLLPPAILNRSKKGFAVPIGTWFRTSLRDPLRQLLTAPTSFVATHLHLPAILNLLDEHQSQQRDHTHRLFALLMLELWAQEFPSTLE